MRTDDFASSDGSSPVGTRMVALLAVIGYMPVSKGASTPIFEDGDTRVYAYALASEAVLAALKSLKAGHKCVASVWLGEIGSDKHSMLSKARRAAECAEFGEPGQVVLTLAVAETARELLPADMRVLELGNRSTSDGGVERLFFVEREDVQSGVAGTTADREPTLRFIGRGRELAEIEDRVTRYRLLTVTGPAGIGKTTLVRRVLDEMDSESSVWYLDASTLASPTLLCSALTETLDIRKRALQTHMEALLTGAEFRDGVLAIDASSRDIAEVRAVVRALLNVAPNLAVVVAAPRSLRLPNESVYPLKGLEQPTGPEHWQSLKEYDALAFFESRAAAMVLNFNITRDNAETIAMICKRLDGNPAALTLAVAKLRVLSPAQILDRLEQPLIFLKSATAQGLERHQTLQQMIAVTVDPLSEAAKALLARMAVVEGALSFDDVEELFPKYASLTAFEELADAGLLEARDSNQDARRFAMSRSLREYAFGTLDSNAKEETQDRRFEYFESVAVAAGNGLVGKDEVAWTRRMEDQCGDVSATIRALTRKGELERASLMLASGLQFWYNRNFPMEALSLAEELLKKRGDFPSRARMDNFAAVMALRSGDPSKANVYAQRALQRAQKEGNLVFEGFAHTTLGMIAHQTKDFEGWAEHSHRGAALFRKIGDRVRLMTCLTNLIGAAMELGRHEEVLEAAREVFSLEDEQTSRSQKSHIRNNLADYYKTQGNYKEARHYVHEAILLLESSGYAVEAALELRTLAHILIADQRFEEAAFFFGGAQALLEHDEGILNEYEMHETAQGIELISAVLGSKRLNEKLAAGRVLDVDEIILAAIAASGE